MQVLEKVARAMGKKYNVRIIFRGSKAATNGNTIILPSLPEEMQESDIIMARGYCDHEVGHVRHTDFHTMKAMIGRDKKLHKVWNYIEDLMVERKMGEEFIGAKENMNFLAQWIVSSPHCDLSHPLMKLFVEGRREICGYKIVGTPSYRRELEGVFGADVFNRIRSVEETHDAVELARHLIKKYEESKKKAEEPPKPRKPESKPEKSEPRPEPKRSEPEPEEDPMEKPEPEECESECGDEGDGDKDGSKDEDSFEGEESESGSSGEEKDLDHLGDDTDDGHEDDLSMEDDFDPFADDSEEPGGEEEEGDESREKDSSSSRVEDEPEEDPSADESDSDKSSGKGDPEEDESGEEPDSGESDESDSGKGEDDGDSADSSDGNENDLGGDSEELAGEDDNMGEATDSDPSEGLGDSEFDDFDEDSDPVADDEEEDGGTASEGRKSSHLPEMEEAEDPYSALKEYIEGIHAIAMTNPNDYMVWNKDGDVLEPMYESRTTIAFDRLKASLGSLNVLKGKAKALFLARTQSRWLTDREEGRVNSRSLARLVAGTGNRVFKKKYVSKDRDTAISFLVDYSGSMRGRSLEAAMEAVVCFLESLEGTVRATEVLTYTTRGISYDSTEFRADPLRHEYGRVEWLDMKIIKGFDEPYGARIKRRISAWESQTNANNCDGDCVDIAWRRLLARREKRKILFVLSDGLVGNHGNWEKGVAYLKRVCENVTRSGVELIGVGLNVEGLDEYYPHSINLKNAGDLAQHLFVELRKILRV